MTDARFTPEQIDTSRPHPARMYDYYLGGRDNYEVDREAAERVLKLAPEARSTARGNRDFLHRAVRAVVERGIRQIVDVGTGIPTAPHTHEAARAVAPGVRVAYVDNDPIVAGYADAKLTGAGDAAFVLADAREPDAIMEHPALRGLIDFGQPVALMLVALLHFVTDAEDPAKLVKSLTERLAPGSCLIVSHGTADFSTHHPVREATQVYDSATAGVTLRTHAEILPFFAGFDLLEPGLVQLNRWRPEGPGPAEEDLWRCAGYGGVGVKPA
jgi:SAM-dependent methyltransferase